MSSDSNFSKIENLISFISVQHMNKKGTDFAISHQVIKYLLSKITIDIGI